MMKLRKIIWISAVPSHYVRTFHCEIEKQSNSTVITFIYIRNNKIDSNRAYESGVFPKNSFFIDGHSLFSLLSYMGKQHITIYSGNYPRLVLLSIFFPQKLTGHKMYWSDANIFDFYKKTKTRQIIDKIYKKIIFRKIDTILYIGKSNKQYVENILGKNKKNLEFKHLPYPALLMDDAIQNKFRSKKIKLLSLGRLIDIKGIDILINSLALLAPKMLNKISLAIVGSGNSMIKLKKLSSDLQLDNTVTFYGAVPSDEVASYYADSDVFILPSLYEPWALVVNEALSSGMPVITSTSVGSANDLIKDGFNGFLLDQCTPDKLCNILVKLISMDRESLKEMSANSRNSIINSDFHLTGSINKFIHVTQNNQSIS